MADEHVIPDDPNAPPAKEEPTVEELQRRAEHAERLLEDERKQKEFWHGHATAKPAEKPAEKKEESPDLDDLSEADLVDVISGNDKGKFSKIVRAEAKKLLKEMGVTTKTDVEQLVTGKLTEAKSESSGLAELVQQHPDLADKDSELYQEAARQLDEIGKDSTYDKLSDFAKVKLATKLAAAELKQSGGSNKAEAARASRIAAQQGSTGSRKPAQREESDELTQEEKDAARIFGITEKDFVANKKEQKMFRR